MVTNAIDHGVSAMPAATVLSAASFASPRWAAASSAGSWPTAWAPSGRCSRGLTLQAVAVSLYVFTRDLAGFYGLALVFRFAYGGVMPLYAILLREYFGGRIIGTALGAVAFVFTLGMALGPWAGGWLYDAFGSYFWLFIGSFGIGLGPWPSRSRFARPRRFPPRSRAQASRADRPARGGSPEATNRAWLQPRTDTSGESRA